MSITEPESLRDVSDTALWVAAYRAEETERSDALFHDPYARVLTGERGFRLLDAVPKGRARAWPMVVRTALLDTMVRERLAAGCDFVVNLAAGLDARPYRMELPAELPWVEVDLPGMIDYKRGILGDTRPRCLLERIAADLADGDARRTLLRELSRRGERGLVLTEGLLIYLDEISVGALAEELAEAGRYRWWGTDLVSPGLLRWMSRSWGDHVASAGAPFRFAPEDGPGFFAARGWRTLELHGSLHAAGRMHRLPFLYSLLARVLPEPKSWNPKRVWGGVCLFESG